MKNEELLKGLKVEQEELLKKLNQSRTNGDYGTYKNLVIALKDIVSLINREEDRAPINPIPIKWDLKWSKYKLEDNTPMISIWEQNQYGEIRNTEKFRLYDDEMLKLVIHLMNQICINDYMDSNGHTIKQNRSYIAMSDYLLLNEIKKTLNN